MMVFNAAHQTLYLDIDKTMDVVAKYFWWPSLIQDVRYCVKTCVECQAVKIIRHNWPNFFSNQTRRFQFVHIDLVGLMDLASNNNRYILTMKDRRRSYLVTAQIPDKRALTVRDAFVQSLCGYYGVPQVVMSYNGK